MKDLFHWQYRDYVGRKQVAVFERVSASRTVSLLAVLQDSSERGMDEQRKRYEGYPDIGMKKAILRTSRQPWI